uniref:Uncharacterized protein n=1 Tax=Nelumbo nucifera TaxID=4432 RepID=A0A822XU34_NELNU|nr:TPA_asm: hypothetical protein HUJ06_023869 [Nelumbo nucifera]
MELIIRLQSSTLITSLLFPNCSNLCRLRFLAGPVSPSALVSLSSSCKHLVSLSISSFRPFSFRWLTSFPSLKELFVVESHTSNSIHFPTLEFDSDDNDDGTHTSLPASELPLESLCLTGIGAGDRRIGWPWRRCTKLRRLQLRSCEGTGDGASFSFFVRCLQGLQELELRTCRTIADGVLLRLAEHDNSLNSFLIYDGGGRDDLHQFIRRCSSTLQKLDLRLPLDLDNDHLSAVAKNFRGVSLRLQSCCLVTGEGLKTLGTAMIAGLEELALIN